ncbi:MAG: DUF2934 domain-containing protein [Cellvibrio sp.]|uniref:DUF2934 domain-containing protein n=1 Tax=Cellvibrio sp. TaxID=1965322 RepID=UPI0031A28CFE
MNITDQNVRDLAYKIWELEGCPIGHESRHWEMALKLANNYRFDSASEFSEGKMAERFPDDLIGKEYNINPGAH